MSDKRILLIIGGGIAAYKALLLIRLLKTAGLAVRVVLTGAGAEFVTALSAAALSGDKVYQTLFDLTDEAEMGHIELSRSADLVVVAPATADLMAKMATGQANDLATTLLLATDKPVLIAPAMNVRMWQHAATKRNLAQLQADGVRVIGPDDGDMACGEFGPGRMSEPEAIFATITEMLAGSDDKPLAGKKILITAGPTHEAIDPVRYIANRSSGKQGYAIAEAAHKFGAEVVLVSGPVALPPVAGVRMVMVESALEMLHAVEQNLPVDIAICAAAVADWRVADAATQKLKKVKGQALPSFELSENPDILRTISGAKKDRPSVVVGFAAETQNVIENAQTKLNNKGCDIIVANDVGAGSEVMGGSENQVHVLTAKNQQSWPRASKREVAEKLMLYLAEWGA